MSNPFSDAEASYVAAAPIGHLATVTPAGQPHVVPVCFAVIEEELVIPLDEKPKSVPVRDLQRVRNITETPAVSLVVDHYESDWSRLGWVQVRGTAAVRERSTEIHSAAVQSLRAKYSQYREQSLEDRPCIWIRPDGVVSWGNLDPIVFTADS